jgi:hypothetical protein
MAMFSTAGSTQHQTGVFCDLSTQTFSCPAGSTITQGNTSYGRWDNSTCPGPGVPYNGTKTVANKLSQDCIGKQSCTVTATPNALSSGVDPIPNVRKQAMVTYTCGPVKPPIPINVISPTTAKITTTTTTTNSTATASAVDMVPHYKLLNLYWDPTSAPIKCPTGSTIEDAEIEMAGVPSNVNMSHMLSISSNASKLTNPQKLSLPQDCVGQNSCDIPITHLSNSGAQIVAIQYNCQQSSIADDSSDTTQNKKKKKTTTTAKTNKKSSFGVSMTSSSKSSLSSNTSNALSSHTSSALNRLSHMSSGSRGGSSRGGGGGGGHEKFGNYGITEKSGSVSEEKSSSTESSISWKYVGTGVIILGACGLGYMYWKKKHKRS